MAATSGGRTGGRRAHRSRAPSADAPAGQDHSHDVYTVANIITVLRLILVPFFFAVLVNGDNDVLGVRPVRGRGVDRLARRPDRPAHRDRHRARQGDRPARRPAAHRLRRPRPLPRGPAAAVDRASCCSPATSTCCTARGVLGAVPPSAHAGHLHRQAARPRCCSSASRTCILELADRCPGSGIVDSPYLPGSRQRARRARHLLRLRRRRARPIGTAIALHVPVSQALSRREPSSGDIVKAVIMAGGEGTRLRPLTSLRPKPMVPIVNQPVMEHILGLVKHHGITEVVATLAFMPQVIQDYFGDGEEWGVTIELRGRGDAAGHRRLGEERRAAARRRRAVPRDLRRRADRHRPERGHRVPQGEGRRGHDRAQARRRPARVRRRHHRRGRPDRALPREAHVGPGLLGHHQHRHLRDRAVGARLHSRRRRPSTSRPSCSRSSWSKGHALYGIAVDGYWCDVGSRESYMRGAPRHPRRQGADLHPRRARAARACGSPRARKIDPDATLGDKVVIGENVQDPRRRGRSATTPSSATTASIGNDARVDPLGRVERHLRRQAGARSRARCSAATSTSARAPSVDVGAVIGDESIVGHGRARRHRRAGLPVQAHRARGDGELLAHLGVDRRALAVRRGGHPGSRGHRHHAGARAARSPRRSARCCPRAGTSS